MLRSKHSGRRRVLPSSCAQITFKQVRQLDPLTFSIPVSMFVVGTNQATGFMRQFRVWSVSCAWVIFTTPRLTESIC